MRAGFYPKLAWEGIRKNKRMYTPYIFTCIGMIMMNYIIAFLSGTPALEHVRGSGVISQTLGMAWWIVSLFAVIFLFYSNSFLMRRRKKEFGMYNILGMGKWNISKIMFWDSLIVAVVSLVVGLAAGVGLSKLFELGLINLVAGDVDYTFTVFPDTITATASIYAGIFGLLFLNSLRQIALSNPIELFGSESVGEKPPKANWLLGVAGVVIMAAAYSIALGTKNAVYALTWFFVAAAMVIIATYLLFGSGSVILCRLLQRNKAYYYKTNHFVSVSSMVYRMKRNGAGLASICILLTIVLVMLSATAALYIGSEDVILSRYPKDINVTMQMQGIEYTDDQSLDLFRNEIQTLLDQKDAEIETVIDYRTAYTVGILSAGAFVNDEETMETFYDGTASEAIQLFIVPISDYNRIMGENAALKEDEVLVYPSGMEYSASTFQMNGGKVYKVKGQVEDWVSNGDASMTIIPTVYVFVEDLDAFTVQDRAQTYSNGSTRLDFGWIYSFDLNVSPEVQMDICNQMKQSDWVRGLEHGDIVYAADVEGQEEERAGFYTMHGGLFYIGILLSIVFLMAAVLIIYYKQISEGYEDQNRFEIMQKVGMTKKDIRKSINSQMLTVFYLPLITAGIHLVFAFPMIRMLLLCCFNLQNTALMIVTTVVCFVVFGIFYALVYKITSNAYYTIVSGRKE